jgi:hypothetical protein
MSQLCPLRKLGPLGLQVPQDKRSAWPRDDRQELLRNRSRYGLGSNLVNLLQNSPPGTDASHGQASAALLQALALLARVVGALHLAWVPAGPEI